jgi:hypothetical protein
MPKTVYIGRKSYMRGKTAFEILANLKNFGIGRMLARNEFDKYPEPSYHIIRRVEPRMDEELKFGTIWCETVFRAKRWPGIRRLDVGYHPDYKLIPKDEEQDFLRGYKISELGDKLTVLPKYYSVPPLMKLFLIRHNRENGLNVDQNIDFKIPFVYLDQKDLNTEKGELFWLTYRIAEESEEPDLKFDGKYEFNQNYLEGLKTDF